MFEVQYRFWLKCCRNLIFVTFPTLLHGESARSRTAETSLSLSLVVSDTMDATITDRWRSGRDAGPADGRSVTGNDLLIVVAGMAVSAAVVYDIYRKSRDTSRTRRG
jgi:hypothetical protein